MTTNDDMMIIRLTLMPVTWLECHACGAIFCAIIREVDTLCARCRAYKGDISDFVGCVLADADGVILSSLDRRLLYNHFYHTYPDYHARGPLEASTWLPRESVDEDVAERPGDETCPVCIEPMRRGVEVTLSCHHRAHRECVSLLIPGVVSGVRCPICRTPVGRGDLPWDTSVHAVIASVRKVERAMTLNDDGPTEGVEHHDFAIYHVCAMQIINSLIDHRCLQWNLCMYAVPDVDAMIESHVCKLQRENKFLESTLHALSSD